MRADRRERLGADHQKTADHHQGAERALQRQSLLQHDDGQQQSAERRARRLDNAAVPERNEQEAGIAEQALGWAAEQSESDPPPPANAAEVGKSGSSEQGQTGQSGPRITVQRDI